MAESASGLLPKELQQCIPRRVSSTASSRSVSPVPVQRSLRAFIPDVLNAPTLTSREDRVAAEGRFYIDFGPLIQYPVGADSVSKEALLFALIQDKNNMDKASMLGRYWKPTGDANKMFGISNVPEKSGVWPWEANHLRHHLNCNGEAWSCTVEEAKPNQWGNFQGLSDVRARGSRNADQYRFLCKS